MSMVDAVDSYLDSAGIYTGWQAQLQLWRDTDVANDRFIVLQTSGGTPLTPGLGADYYFSIFVIGRRGMPDIQECGDKANEIIEHIKNNGVDKCLGHIQMQSPLGQPSLTEEKRVVYELLVRVVRG